MRKNFRSILKEAIVSLILVILGSAAVYATGRMLTEFLKLAPVWWLWVREIPR